MTRLSDTQLVILNAAAQRDDRNALPLPGSLRGGAAAKVVGALLSRGLVAETVTESMAKADPALNTFWRNEADGRAVLLNINGAGLQAIGVEPEGCEPTDKADNAVRTAERATEAPSAGKAKKAPAKGAGAPRAPRTREGTKQAALIALLRKGATIDEMVAATGWQSHTVRGAMAGALKKRLGLTIASEKEERGRVYRIAD
jgi:hypothetical protein